MPPPPKLVHGPPKLHQVKFAFSPFKLSEGIFFYFLDYDMRLWIIWILIGSVNFPMTRSVRRSIGWSVCHNFLKGGKLHFHRSTCSPNQENPFDQVFFHSVTSSSCSRLLNLFLNIAKALHSWKMSPICPANFFADIVFADLLYQSAGLNSA